MPEPSRQINSTDDRPTEGGRPALAFEWAVGTTYQRSPGFSIFGRSRPGPPTRGVPRSLTDTGIDRGLRDPHALRSRDHTDPGGGHRSVRSLGGNTQTNTNVVVRVRRSVVVAVRRTAVVVVVVPRPAAQHTNRTRSFEILTSVCSIVGIILADRAAPFENVAGHVVGPRCLVGKPSRSICGEEANGARLAYAGLIAVASVVLPVVAPRVLIPIGAACGPLPFRFRREPHFLVRGDVVCLSQTACEPATIGYGLVPCHADHRMVR